MNRSVTSRNFLGGFLGGSLGILISWYVTPMILPLGVLIGVIIGWWAEDIAQVSVYSFRTAVGFWKQLKKRWVSFHARLECTGVLLASTCRKVAKTTQYVILLPLTFLLPLLLMRRFRQWTTHPVSRAFLISTSAIIIGAALNAIAVGILWPWPETYIIGGYPYSTPEQIVPFGFSEIALSTGLATLFLTMFGSIGIILEDDKNDSMKSFYSRWERYSRSSPISYFARQLFLFFLSELRATILLIMMLAYWVTLGGALIAFVTIPVTMFVTFMVGVYKIAQRSTHWWCFGVTLIVTATSALIFYGNFNNEAVLWTIALCTGIASGIATEGLRRLGIWWNNTETGRHYLSIWYDEYKVLPFSIAEPTWRTLGRTFEKLTFQFF